MANGTETVTIVELDIDQKTLVKELEKLTREIDENKQATKELTAQNKKLEAEGKKGGNQHISNARKTELLKVKTKELSTQYRQNQGTLVALTTSETKQIGTLQKLEIRNKALRAESKTLDLTRKEGQKRLTQINQQLDVNNKFISDNSDQLKKQKINVGAYGSALQGVGGPIGGAVSGFGAMTKAAKAFIATPIGLVIAAIGAALGALTAFFKSSEDGQNALTKVTKVFSSILDNLMDVLANVGEALFNLFTKPKEAAQDFVDFIGRVGEFFKNTFGNIIGGALEVFIAQFQKRFAQAGLVWQKFKGIFTDNAEKILEAQAKIDEANEKIDDGFRRTTKGIIELGNAVDKAKGKIKGFFEEIQDDARIARELADEEAAIRKQERFNIVENAKLAKQSARLRAEAEQQKLVDAEQSLKLFSQSFDLDQKIIEAEIDIAKRKAEAARIAGTLAKSNIETLDEIARLEADVENKRKAFDEIRRGRTRRLNAIRLEAFKQEKERLSAQLELEEIFADQVIRQNQRIIDNELSTNDQILEATKQNTAIRLELLAEESDLELAEINSRLNLQLISQADFEQQRQLIKERFADESLQLLEKNLATELELSESVSKSKVDLAKGITASLDALFEENTIASKFAAIAQALINTYLGAQAAFAQTPGGIGIKVGAAIAATAIGLANVRKIRQVQTGGGSQSGSASTGIPSPILPQTGFANQPGVTSDGGLSTRSLTGSQLTQEGIERALASAPQKVAIIEEITAKQRSQKAVSVVATV